MTTSNAIIPFNPQEAVDLAIAWKQVLIAVLDSEVLKENVDFGKIPGTDKNVLLKPGAERLCSAFKLTPVFEPVSQVEDFARGFFFYRYSCTLVHRETGEAYGRGIGSCNSQESKYGWRWVSADRVPSHLNPDELLTRGGAISEFDFAIKKAETSGKYGKPAEYWQAFQTAIDNGTARKIMRKTSKGESEAWEISAVEYRIPNPDVFDLVNTIDKMAQKRALIAATLIATNASEFFTQDMEDFFPMPLPAKTPATDVVEGQFEEISTPTPANGKPAWWDIVLSTLRKLGGMDDARFADFSVSVKALLTMGTLTAAMKPQEADKAIRQNLPEYFAQTADQPAPTPQIEPDADAQAAAAKDAFDIFPN